MDFKSLPQNTQDILTQWYEKFEAVNLILPVNFIVEDGTTGAAWINAYIFGPAVGLSNDLTCVCEIKLHWGNVANISLCPVTSGNHSLKAESFVDYNKAVNGELQTLRPHGLSTETDFTVTWETAYGIMFRLACAFKTDVDIYSPIPAAEE